MHKTEPRRPRENKNEQRISTVPALVTEAERFLRDDLQPHVGQTLDDGVEPKLRLHVQATVAAWRVRVQVAGRWKPVTLGRVGELGIEGARRKAAVLRKCGYRFASQELLDEVLGRKSNPLGTDTAPAFSVMDCFLAGMKKLVDGGKLKVKTAQRYQAALRACGKEFYDLSVFLAGPAETRRAVTAFRRCYSRPYSRNLQAALDIAFEYAIDHHQDTGVTRNPTISLRDIDYDVTDTSEPRENLEWDQVRALWCWLCDKRCPLTPTQIRLYQTMLLTGERIDTLSRARWSQIGEDDWWVIPPQERKLRLLKPGQTPPLYIRMTEVLWQILGEPGSNGSSYIFPAESDLAKPYPQGGRPLFRLFRVREALQRGISIEAPGRKGNVPSPLSGSMSKATAKRERGLLRRYGTFLIPDEVPVISHHEAGRHTVATLAQEECIPGVYVSRMLGHAVESSVDVPILHHSAYARLTEAAAPPMPRALQRQAAALATTGKTARQHYTTVRDSLRGIEAAWIFWTAAFCREVIGAIPASVAEAREGLLGTDDQLLAILQARFPDMESALQHVAAGHYLPTLHTVRS